MNLSTKVSLGETAPVPTSDAFTRLIELLRRGPVTVLTGAGLSTASGVPAYRDSAGQWRHAAPIRHQDFLTSDTVRRRYWARSFVGWPRVGQAVPNPGHHALAALEASGAVSTVITQNVDGLHQKAGSRNLIELHGAIRQVRCLSCGATFAREAIQDWLMATNPSFTVNEASASVLPDGDAALEDASYAGFNVPVCADCAGILKPDVVFFGDNVPRERVQAAMQAVEQAVALLVVGSSLMVYSGYRFAERAHQLGKPVVAINQGVTRADDLLTLKLDADCGATLERVVRDLAGCLPA
jgi:NAD-dependent SIR2 family protein deacetylase